ncbi:MAG: signal recognition particle receptor subunit alpha, partial [Planctomycetia bacterium]
MFESIQAGIGEALRHLRGATKMSEANIAEGLVAVRRALLEADVHLEVADKFVARVKESAVGQNVLKSINPAQQIVGVVYQELAKLMGPVDATIRIKPNQTTVIMMCGLQGSGKTTTCGKLAKLLLSQGQHPLLVAADLQRPAAVDQLKVLGEQVGVPVYAEAGADPIKVCQNGVAAAKKQNRNVVILDTAGRLHVDDALMRELRTIDQKVHPNYCYLVCDAMTGQDAVASAKAFNDALELDAVVLTKLDGDAR